MYSLLVLLKAKWTLKLPQAIPKLLNLVFHSLIHLNYLFFRRPVFPKLNLLVTRLVNR